MRQFSKAAGVFRAKADGRRAEILIYDEIGDEPTIFPVNPTDFAVALKQLEGEVDEVVLRINSPGGGVWAGVAMYNTLRQFKGKKTVQIDGLCASIATVLAMAADEIVMADTAMMMIHNPRIVAFMMADSTKLKELGQSLDDVQAATMIPAYKRSGKSTEEINALLNDRKDHYFSAQQAKDAGWIDSILDLPKPQRLAAHVSYDLKAFADAPVTLALAVDGCTCKCTGCLAGDCTTCSDVGCACEGCVNCPKMSMKDAGNTDISAETERIALISAERRAENLRLAEIS